MRELTPGKEDFEQPRKGMSCSRSFGGAIITIENVGEAVLMPCARRRETAPAAAGDLSPDCVTTTSRF
jgi:hypothetical protein